ncbi:hypothetical protein B0H10DRAFT_1951832 [Mycena sp. CBHHK59/15]|nr:hypothetical protein B0H10DRAFT_1951832 [Mycena sp. CBHHK59/15]
MTGPGLKEEDPLMILDDEDDNDIEIVDGPPATPSSSASHQPQQPLHQPLISSVFTPLSALGSGMPRMVVLQAKDVLVGGITITGDRVCNNLLDGLECPICFGLKLNPVVATCTHSFCYVCICLALESSFNCPLCMKLTFKPPHRVIPLEDLMAALYPNMPDNTAVEWGRAWDGLNFPVNI